MHLNIKIQVSCDKNQSTLDSSSIILYPIDEVRGRKNCSNGQEAKFLDRSSNTFPDKILKHQIRGRNASGYKNSG